MSIKRIIVPIDLAAEVEIKGRIASSLQTRDFRMVNPTHPMGYTVNQLYLNWIGERLEDLMAIRYSSQIWLPTDELSEMFEMLREFDEVIYNLMPTRELKADLLSSTCDGFALDALPVATLLFTLKDIKPAPSGLLKRNRL